MLNLRIFNDRKKYLKYLGLVLVNDYASSRYKRFQPARFTSVFGNRVILHNEMDQMLVKI